MNSLTIDAYGLKPTALYFDPQLLENASGMDNVLARSAALYRRLPFGERTGNECSMSNALVAGNLDPTSQGMTPRNS